ncbi:MAG: hypothetical protein QOI12_5215 [Alphaproteobacteria bacterium]|nr:hypothetical protein [Alphaproteobacteria bacterium]
MTALVNDIKDDGSPEARTDLKQIWTYYATTGFEIFQSNATVTTTMSFNTCLRRYRDAA